MIILLLLACIPKPAPPLWSAPFARIEARPLGLKPPPPGTCPEWIVVDPGDVIDCSGVAGPATGPHSLAALIDARRRAALTSKGLDACYAGRQHDREWATEQHAKAWAQYQKERNHSNLVRKIAPIGIAAAFVAGGITGVAIGSLSR